MGKNTSLPEDLGLVPTSWIILLVASFPLHTTLYSGFCGHCRYIGDEHTYIKVNTHNIKINDLSKTIVDECCFL